MSDKVNHDDVVKAFSLLSDDVLCIIGATLDHYLGTIYNNMRIAHLLSIDDNIDEIRNFVKLIRVYLCYDDILISELERIRYEK